MKRFWLCVLATALVLTVVGCAGQQATRRTPRPSGVSPSAQASLPPTPSAADLGRPITNPWYPLQQGMKWVYQGVKDGEVTTDTMTVTSKTKQIMGVPATVVSDELTSHGRVVESTEDWFTQDAQGNVWYLGEATTSFNPDGSVESTEGSWQAGVNGARAGIFMPATPTVGAAYFQEYYKGQAEDRFRILSMHASVTVPYGSFSDAMRTYEQTRLEPNVATEKFYIRGIGMVAENDVKGPTEFNKLVTFHK